MDNFGTMTSPNHAKNTAQKNNRYIPGLDGLRALAVIGVILYHLNLSFVPGGLLGVGVFFVLSGYLITDILLEQWRRTGRIDLKDFWLRRARRLLPALLLVLLAVTAWSMAFGLESPSLRGDLVAALLYVSNWWFIFHHVSYFASFAQSPLGHLWSLAVEEQFYLVWPLLLILLLKFHSKKGFLSGIIVLGAVSSALAMAVLYQPGTDPSRVYYGTDTRSFALLIGALLAVLWPSKRLALTLSPGKRFSLDLVGTIGLLGILVMYVVSNEYQSFLYRGGMVLLSVLTAATIAALVHPTSRLGKILGFSPLRWIGVRSYGIYLWHYPVIILTTPSVDTNGFNVLRAILQVAASVLLAALSWRFIEKPIRYYSGRAGATDTPRSETAAPHSETRRGRKAENRAQLTRRVGLPAGFLLVVGLLGAYLVRPISVATASSNPPQGTIVPTFASSDNSNASGQGNDQSPDSNLEGSTNQTTGNNGLLSAAVPNNTSGTAQNTSNTATNSNHSSAMNTNGVDSTSNSSGASTFVSSGNTSTLSSGNTAVSSPSSSNPGGSSGPISFDRTSGSGLTVQSGIGMTAIGDSVMLDIQPDLQKLLPGIVIDGKVGRQMIEAPSEISLLKSKGELGSNVVVIELGTNGPFTQQQLVSLLNSLSSIKHIVLVNTRVPRPWQNVVNATLASVVKSYPKAVLVDWYSASAGKNNFFYPDGVHLNPTGSGAYAELVAQTIKSLSSGQ